MIFVRFYSFSAEVKQELEFNIFAKTGSVDFKGQANEAIASTNRLCYNMS